MSSASRSDAGSRPRGAPDSAEQAVVLRLDGQGRIPFDFRIGITGHRCLSEPEALIPAIQRALRLLTGLLPVRASCDVVLVAASSLAEGADRLVARELLAEPGSRLEVFLPIARREYMHDFTSADSKKEFRHLLARASQVRQAPAFDTRDEAYEAAGRQVVDRCDALIAVWDGEPAQGRGGTAEIVQYARECKVPVVWVHTDAPVPTTEPHDHGERMRALRSAMRDLTEYNRSEFTDLRFQARIRAQRQEFGLSAVPAAADDALGWAREGVAAWLIPFLVRADLLAERLHRRFTRLSAAMFAMAAAAVGVVAIQTNFFPDQDWLVSVEVLLLLALLAIPLLRNRLRLQERWTAYRFLAERLRSAYFLVLAGTRDRPQQPGGSASFSDPAVAWLERALAQIMAGRPHVALASSQAVSLRECLSNCWIGRQMAYHSAAARRYGAWEKWLRNVIAILFGITLVSAVLHAIGLGPKLHLAAELIFLSISVPAVGAAIHGIGAHRDYRRQAERCSRMVDRLAQLGYQMDEAQSLSQIRQIAVNVERSMREESHDWFGAMRFHDIELIT